MSQLHQYGRLPPIAPVDAGLSGTALVPVSLDRRLQVATAGPPGSLASFAQYHGRPISCVNVEGGRYDNQIPTQDGPGLTNFFIFLSSQHRTGRSSCACRSPFELGIRPSCDGALIDCASYKTSQTAAAPPRRSSSRRRSE